MQIFKDNSKSATWGEAKYTGRRNDNNFPTTPLHIPATSFVVYFHSDGSNTDWGFKLVATKKAKTALSVSEQIRIPTQHSYPSAYPSPHIVTPLPNAPDCRGP